MKTGNWNKMPMWARFFAVLLGIPLAAALLRAGFEHEFHKLTALILASVASIVLYLFLHWRFTSCSVPAAMSAEEKKRERRQVTFCINVLFAAGFLVGGVLFLAVAVFPPEDLPSLSRWVVRFATLSLGGLFLMFGVFFIAQCRMLVTGKRSLTIRFGWRNPDK